MTSPSDFDADLARTVRRTGYMRQGFYATVLTVALAGQVTGAVEALHIPVLAAVPAVAALELAGVVVLSNADVRRRLGERAVASRLLSAVIAAWAVAFNWLAHADHMRGGFFAGMSALGYLVWLMHSENQRRDRLRARGDLAHTTPAYEAVGHWLAHPWLTRRARSLAKADPQLGLYDSLAAARGAVRRERQHAAISKVLHRKIRAAVDPTTADIAVHVYDLGEVAARLADSADYDGLTALIAVDLAPARLAAGKPAKGMPVEAAATVEPVPVDDPYAVPVGYEFWEDADEEAYHLAAELAGTTRPAIEAPQGGLEGVPAESKPKRRPPVPDQVILKALKDPYLVPRRPDGTVAVRELERRWRCRQDRAVRLLQTARLYQPGDPPGVPATEMEDVPA